ncbi:MAG: discoidin domain-containing protein [Candidatus Gracilibacteria bacterium]|nr:discoidin domain-containing protein [Candidatus Gracilibacteria bacterium]
MNSKNKKGSIFIYVLILINVALIIGYVVFNNTYILNNNINIGKNAEEVFLKLSDKANINIESVRQYNKNGGGFSDALSCPTNITMSGTVSTGAILETGINSEMRYDFGTVYCYFTFNGTEGRIYFDDTTQDFSTVYYGTELKDIVNNAFTPGGTIDNSSISATASPYTSEQPSKSLDGSLSTQYKSKKGDYNQITFDLGSEKKLSKVTIFKKVNQGATYWDNGIVYLKNAGNVTLKTITLPGIDSMSTVVIPLSYSSYADADNVRYIQIVSDHTNRFLNVSEIEVTELSETGNDSWSSDSVFSDPNQSIFIFDTTGIGGIDLVDDNMNSDNYRSTSTGVVGYPGDYFDDDITPRTTIFGSVSPGSTDYYNIFWNNYITNDMINNNIFNDDNPLILAKIGDVTEGYLFFDMFSKIDSTINYDMKIIEFDRNDYKDKYTLLPIGISETKNMTEGYGYLQKNGEVLSFSRYKTGNEFKFDFKNKDYSIYLINHLTGNIAYRITGEEKPASGLLTDYGRGIYINPIDDSKPNVIETIANHIIIGGEKNFIGENFKVVGPK